MTHDILNYVVQFSSYRLTSQIFEKRTAQLTDNETRVTHLNGLLGESGAFRQVKDKGHTFRQTARLRSNILAKKKLPDLSHAFEKLPIILLPCYLRLPMLSLVIFLILFWKWYWSSWTIILWCNVLKIIKVA